MADVQWADAIRQVLHGAGEALHYNEIADRIVQQGLRKTVGATPNMTVASIVSTSLKTDPSSPFERVGKGYYTLKELLTQHSPKTLPEPAISEDADTEDAGAIRAFGMFWRRELVVWNSKPKLLGRQGQGATNVDFSGQLGVYLLYDRDRVIYVGRAADTLGLRLRAHTVDRLSGRWDRFSWFGLQGVSPGGDLIPSTTQCSPEVLVETMEALLIESLEPPLNRKRGDNFSSLEYLQAEDPSIKASREKKILEELAKRAGLSGSE